MADISISKKLNNALSTSPDSRQSNDQVIISRRAGVNLPQQLTVSFQRTVRVADNGEENALPPSLGSFPIYCTADLKSKLPLDMAVKSGYMIPMYRK